MPHCAVKNCKIWNNMKNFNKDIKFFSFPKDPERSELWVKACGKGKFNTKNARICSLHFTDEQWRLEDKLLNIPLKKRLLNAQAIPTANLPENNNVNTLTISRKNRADNRSRKKIVKEAIKDYELSEEIDGLCTVDGLCTEVDENKNNVGIQTEVQLECARELKIMELENKLKLCQEEKEKAEEKAKQECDKLKNMENSVKHIFTKGQIKKLQNPKKKIKWSLDDISSAICLHSAGPRAYRYLYKKNHPLPGPSTLRAWPTKINVRPGVLDNVLKLMKDFSTSEKDKVCVLSFDEMKIRSEYEYDRTNDTVLKPSNYVQVAMVRGLMAKWKQPIFYNYDCRITVEILNDIIVKMNESGYTVVAVVSDMGSSNQGLWKDLKISTSQTWFSNPTNVEKKIFVFADVPHLIKLLRNHFLDTGYILNNKILNADPIRDLIKVTSNSDLRISHKLTELHLNVKQYQRQKVKLATQLFSHTTSCALKRFASLGICNNVEQTIFCADFCKVINDYFDLFNSKVPSTDFRDRMKAYGLEIETQNEILKKMNDIITNMFAPKKKTMLPFQKGILISNSSLLGLFNYLKLEHGINFLLTYRLNQDVLENFFSAIRSKGGLHDHPTALEFKYRLRSYLLGRNETLLHAAQSSNVQEDETSVLRLNYEMTEATITQTICSGLNLNFEDANNNSIISNENNDIELENMEFGELHHDAIEYLAEYIIKKLGLFNEGAITSNTQNTSTWTWVNEVSEGGL